MARQNYLVPIFSEIALQHYQLLKDSYQQLEALSEMCGEAVSLQSNITNNYCITVTFAAMSLEAFLNDYAAKKVGDNFYYDNFENLRPFAKLQLIAKIAFNTSVDKGSSIHHFINILFQERNKLVHSKSKKLVGLSEDEYQEQELFLENNVDINTWLIEESMKIDLTYDKKLLDTAHVALRTLKEVAYYIDEHDSDAYAMIHLLRAGWHVDMSREKFDLIASAQRSLGIEPIKQTSVHFY